MLDVIIITAFGREAWLVKKLREMDVKFVAIDVTSYFKKNSGSFTSPFGVEVLENDKIKDDILKCGYIFSQQFQGWCAITGQGVIETHGVLKNFQMTAREDLARKVFSHQMSTYDYPFSILSAPQSFTTSLPQQWMTYDLEGDHVLPSVRVQKGESLEIYIREGGQRVCTQGHEYKAAYLINMLDPYMVRSLSQQGVRCEELAATRDIVPLYIWTPWRIKSEGVEHLSQLPKQSLVVARTDKPWIEENFLILNREAAVNEFVVWVPLIFDLRTNEKYMNDVQERMKNILQQQLKLKSLDIEPHFVSLESGLSPYPVYDQQEVQMYKKWYDRGIFYCGFEVCESFLLSEQIRMQQTCVNGLLQEIERDRQIHT